MSCTNLISYHPRSPFFLSPAGYPHPFICLVSRLVERWTPFSSSFLTSCLFVTVVYVFCTQIYLLWKTGFRFYLLPILALSHIRLNWYDRWRVETCLHLSGIGVASLQSRPRLVTNTRHFAPVAMAIERQCPSVTPSITQLTRGP